MQFKVRPLSVLTVLLGPGPSDLSFDDMLLCWVMILCAIQMASCDSEMYSTTALCVCVSCLSLCQHAFCIRLSDSMQTGL